jgi:peptidoglycan/LPS O-acetylase OafA/YrhL
MGSDQAPRLGHQPALDGLRAVAVLAVMLFHAEVGWAVGGYLGVDAFFVLSGFLITTLLLTEWLRNRSPVRAGSRGRIDLVDFYRRRLRRLLPALLLMLLGVAAYGAFVAKSSDISSLRDDALATLVYVGNWHQMSAPHGYFAQFASPSPLQHTWSLAVEEQWYLIWPLVIVALLHFRMRLATFLKVVVLLAIASAVLMAVLYGNGHDTSRVYYGTDTRAQELLVGSALAVIFTQWGFLKSRRARVTSHLAAVIAVVALVVAWTNVDGSSQWLYQGGFLLLAVCVAVVVLSVIQPDRTPLRWMLSWRPLCWIGAISYGLYLWHWPVYVWLTSARTGVSDPTLLLAIRFAVTFAIATASYYLVEMPIRQQRFRMPSMRFLAPALTAAVAIVIVVVSTRATTSTASAFSHLEQVAANSNHPPRDPFHGTPPPKLQVTATQPDTTTTVPPLPLATPGRPPHIFLTGDSVAVSLGVGLANVAGQSAAVWNHGAFGCGLVTAPFAANDDPGVTEHCTQAVATWVNDARDWHADVVVLESGVWDTFDREFPGGVIPFGTPDYDTWYVSQVQALAKQFVANGAKVVLLNAPCVDTSGYSLGSQGGLWSSFDPSRVPHLNDLFAQAARSDPTDITFFDLNQMVCPGGVPVQQVEGQDVRLDGVHFSTPGSEWVSRWLLPKLVVTP